MKWTKEQPKVPGFYWLKRESESTRVVEIYSIENGSLWVILSPGAHMRLSDIRKKCEWSDVPVDEPEGGV
jgi:hypothetical protein